MGVHVYGVYVLDTGSYVYVGRASRPACKGGKLPPMHKTLVRPTPFQLWCISNWDRARVINLCTCETDVDASQRQYEYIQTLARAGEPILNTLKKGSLRDTVQASIAWLMSPEEPLFYSDGVTARVPHTCEISPGVYRCYRLFKDSWVSRDTDNLSEGCLYT